MKDDAQLLLAGKQGIELVRLLQLGVGHADFGNAVKELPGLLGDAYLIEGVFNLGIFAGKAAQVVFDEVQTHGGREAYCQPAGAAVLQAVYFPQGAFLDSAEVAGLVVENGAGFSQLDIAGPAPDMQERRTVFLLQIFQLGGQGRLGYVQALGSGAQVTAVHDGDKVPVMFEIHKNAPLPERYNCLLYLL